MEQRGAGQSVHQHDRLGYPLTCYRLNEFCEKSIKQRMTIRRIQEYPTTPLLLKPVVSNREISLGTDGRLGLDAACRVEVDGAAEDIPGRLHDRSRREPFIITIGKGDGASCRPVLDLHNPRSVLEFTQVGEVLPSRTLSFRSEE